MKQVNRLLGVCFLILTTFSSCNQKSKSKDKNDKIIQTVDIEQKEEIPLLENPISVEYLQKKLLNGHPRLIYTPKVVDDLKKKIQSDPEVKHFYTILRRNAYEILEQPVLKCYMKGRRMQGQGTMLTRVNRLGVAYMLEKDPALLKRLEQDLLAVSAMDSWNPSHFLDVGTMSLAVALAIDWTYDDLSPEVLNAAQEALLTKGLDPGGRGKARIVKGASNWNQVCNAGMIAAAISVADLKPEVAASTIKRALEVLPNALVQYGPDGVYPEGSSYWNYGTSRSIVTVEMLESAFGKDFGYADYPGFKESAYFKLLSASPSGKVFNFSDCSDKRKSESDIWLSWFAEKTENSLFYNEDRLLKMNSLPRLGGAALVWMSRYEPSGEPEPVVAWAGQGANPIALFNGGESDPHGFFLGCKGGRASISHGNMDAGSFVFDLDGVRWSLDMGGQSYHDLEKIGFNLWSMGQDGDRWKLLTKNNYGHSTLTVNGTHFLVDGFVPMTKFQTSPQPEAKFDLTALYGENAKRATRRFIKESSTSLTIEDEIDLSDSTQNITWQLLTTADVEVVKGGAIMRQDGKTLRLKHGSELNDCLRVVPLNPPPFHLDPKIEGLKRIEIQIPINNAGKNQIKVQVTLAGQYPNELISNTFDR